MTAKNMLQTAAETGKLLSAFIDGGNLYFWVTDNSGGSPLLKVISAENLLRGWADWKLLQEQASDPATPPASGYLMEFAKNKKKYLMDSDGNVAEIGAGNVNPAQMDLRLSLDSSDPAPTGNLTAQTTLYGVKYWGDQISLYDGSSVYEAFDIPSTFYFKPKSTDQTGNLTNGSDQVTSFSGDWKHVAVGMEISGVGIPASTTVTAVNHSTNTLTMSANATADGTGTTLTLVLPADSRWDVFAWNNSNSVELYLLKWTSVSARATGLTYGDGHNYLTGSQEYKYLGNFIVTDTDGELEWSGSFRGIFNENPVRGGQYLLDEASGASIALSGGYMSTATKQAATWTITSDTGTVTDASNMYDGNTGNYGYIDDADDYLNIKVDFGEDTVLDEIEITTPSTAHFTDIIIYGSDTGAFAGEEDTVYSETDGAAGTYSAEFTAAAYRYWKIRLYRNSTNELRINEINFLYGTVLAITGVPLGCSVKLYDDTTLKETVVSDNFVLKNNIVEFTTADIADVDKVTVTKPDGSTPWLEFTSQSFSVGDIYNLMKGQ